MQICLYEMKPNILGSERHKWSGREGEPKSDKALLCPGERPEPLAQGRESDRHCQYIQNKLNFFLYQESNVSREMVGARGFEPPTTATPLQCATRLRYAPTGMEI